MWTALSYGDANAIAPNELRRGVRPCDVALVDVFDCGERDLAASSDWSPPPQAQFLAASSVDGPEKPAPAPVRENPTRVTYTLSLLSDYRRGGVSRTDGKPALQGGVDVRLPQQWNFGARSSNIAKHGNLEIALYGAKSVEIGGADLSIGVTAITYPRDPNGNYIFIQTSASQTLGPFDTTFSIIYAPHQANLDGEDNFYAVARARTPIGSVLGVPVTLNGSLGRMRGHFADARSRSDWSLGLVGRFDAFDIGLTYVDSDLGGPRGRPTTVFSITRSF
jgi:uncharacterized protein (TIGR02001 family)